MRRPLEDGALEPLAYLADIDDGRPSTPRLRLGDDTGPDPLVVGEKRRRQVNGFSDRMSVVSGDYQRLL